MAASPDDAPMDPALQARIDRLYRDHATRLVARLVRISGRVDWAEASVQDAFVAAATAFARAVPDRPAGWLYRVARNRLTDRARREAVRLRTDVPAPPDDEPPEAHLAGEWDDEMLKVIVAVCDPELTMDEAVALALRVLAGLPRASIAALFRADEQTVKKRLTRAKRKLRATGVRPVGPAAAGARVGAAMRVLYALFAEGHKPRSGEAQIAPDLCALAIRLATVMLRQLPDRGPELHALLALMKLNAARLPARSDGAIVLLEDQDRSQWDDTLIDEGIAHLTHSASGDALTATHLEAAIAACHCLAPDFARTDWRRITACYDALLEIAPSATFRVNRAVAVGFAESPDRGLAALGALPPDEVASYLPYHAAVGALAARSGQRDRALSAYRRAAQLSATAADRSFFDRRIAALAEDPVGGIRRG